MTEIQQLKPKERKRRDRKALKRIRKSQNTMARLKPKAMNNNLDGSMTVELQTGQILSAWLYKEEEEILVGWKGKPKDLHVKRSDFVNFEK